LARLWPFLGPAFIAAVAYIDPGKLRHQHRRRRQVGYLLLWVVLAANLIAMVVQTQSAKLGIATGKNLSEACRETFPRPASIGMWIQAEIVAMSCDIAEVVGAALGLNLLFGIPLFPAALLAGAGAFALLALQQRGYRRLEAGIAVLVGVVSSRSGSRSSMRTPTEADRHPPVQAGVQRHGEHPPDHGDHRRDRDAARYLPALGAHAAQDRRPKRG